MYSDHTMRQSGREGKGMSVVPVTEEIVVEPAGLVTEVAHV